MTTPTSKEAPVIITNGRSLDEGSEQPETNGGMKESNSGLVQDKMTKSKAHIC